MLVSVVVCTRNEEQNIQKLLRELMYLNAKGYDYETIVVDDSDDKTPELAKEYGARVINGQRKGLGQAIIDGINSSNGDYIVVIDADGSHPVSEIHNLIEPIKYGCDMTIGSRYVKGGSIIGWTLKRKIISSIASFIAFPLTFKRDNTSGFFAIRKSLVKDIKLQASSWKIMLEVLVKCKPLSVQEVPICFTDRQFGESKFNTKQVIAYLKHLVDLYRYKYGKFIKFCLVGGSGALITFGITAFLTEVIGLHYLTSMILAVILATVWNFTFNLIWTFKEHNFTKSNYEWEAFYNGNPMQKWWKHSIANTVWTWIPAHNGYKVLDCGCGSSPIISKYHNATGIDRNTDKLNFMRDKLPCTKFGVRNYDYDYNAVLCIEVLEHLKNPEEMISSISEVVLKGGKVVIATPDYKRPIWYLAELFTPYKDDHCTKLDRKYLEKLCVKYNLFPIKHKYIAGCDLVELFEKR